MTLQGIAARCGMHRTNAWLLPLLVALTSATLLAGCGSDSGTTTVVTVIERDSGAQSDKPSSADESSASDDRASDGDSLVSDEGTGGESGGGDITVPNEVGKNHQAAQDDLQAHGLYNLSEEDATGQDRMMIWDRNWKVVSQSPAPGTKVSEDATITLRSKKYTDP